MDAFNLARLEAFLKSGGYDAALLTNPASITWITGYAPPIQTGPNPFEGGPALLWFHDGRPSVTLNDWEAGFFENSGVQVFAYTGYTLDGPVSSVAKQATALAEMLADARSLHSRVAVELDALPAAFYEALKECLPQATLVPIENQLTPLRAVKSEIEIQKLKAALHLSDLAQAEIKRILLPGQTELDLWVAVKNCVERDAGGRLPVLADLVAGVRTADVGGLPGAYTVQEGDPVLLDFVPRLDGYWGDNAAAHFAGSPKPELVKAARTALEALDIGGEMLRPGLTAGEVDARVRGHIVSAGYPEYPHHSGHGLGVSYHDEPRIIPNHPMILEPNMVIALEPGVYLPGIGGVRYEDVFLITPGGCEKLTSHLNLKSVF